MKKKLILWMMRTKIYLWALKNVIPYIRFTTYYTSLRGWKYRRGYRILRPGHIILTLDKKKLTTLLIPGEFSHAALCVDKEADWEISEMTHTDYTKSTFFDLCKEADRVVIMECKDWDVHYTRQVVANCKKMVFAKYDIAFSMGVEALYCSELIYQADEERRLQVNLEDLAGIGQEYISPNGLYKAKNGKVLWDSDKEIPWEYKFE